MRQIEPDFSSKNMIFANVHGSKNLRAVFQSDRNNINARISSSWSCNTEVSRLNHLLYMETGPEGLNVFQTTTEQHGNACVLWPPLTQQLTSSYNYVWIAFILSQSALIKCAQTDLSLLSLPSIFNLYYLTFSGFRIFYSLSSLVLSRKTLWLSFSGFQHLKFISLAITSQDSLLKTILLSGKVFSLSPSPLLDSMIVRNLALSPKYIDSRASHMEIEKNNLQSTIHIYNSNLPSNLHSLICGIYRVLITRLGIYLQWYKTDLTLMW